MTKEKGEHRKLRRDVVGDLATSFLSIKARLNFSAMERRQTKMETWLYNCSCCWERRQSVLLKDGVQACNPDIWHTAMASEGSCTGRGSWRLFHYWHPPALSNWLLCLSPRTVLGDTEDGYSQSIMKKHFFFKHHAFENHLNLFHIIKLVCDLVWKFQNHS